MGTRRRLTGPSVRAGIGSVSGSLAGLSGFGRVWTALLVELRAIRDDLSMCLNLGVNALKVELDAKVVVNLMNHYGSSNAINSSLVVDCRHLISQIPQVKVSHCYREANPCIDGLARLETQQFDDVVFYNSPPPPLLDIFLLDLYGHYCTRLCFDQAVSAFVS